MLYVSDIIRKLMIDKGCTVTKLASKMGLLAPSLSRKLQSKMEDYKLSLLADIVGALDCDIVISVVDRESGQVLYTIKEDEKSL